jgi:NADPH2:quinone reductase
MLALIRDGRHDPPVALAEVPEPQPALDEAVVAVHATSLNRGELDLLSARPDGWRPGQDIAGVVASAAPSGDGPPVGTRVVGLVEGGGWSERVAVPVARLASLDDAVSCEQAATLGLAGRTALRVVRLAGPLLGRRVLVVGAGGGVGHLTVQLASLAGGAVERLPRGEDPEEADYDVVLDGVGGTSLQRAVRAIRPGGTIVLFGAVDRQPANLTLLDFIGHEGARILTYFSYASGDEASVGRDLAALAGLVAGGRLRPTLGAVVDWRDAGHALAALRSGEVAGKAVLRIDGSRPLDGSQRETTGGTP